MFSLLVIIICLLSSVTSVFVCPTKNGVIDFLEYEVVCSNESTSYKYHWKNDTLPLTAVLIEYTCFNGSHYSERERGYYIDEFANDGPIASSTFQHPAILPSIDNINCNFSACVCVNSNQWYMVAESNKPCIINEGEKIASSSVTSVKPSGFSRSDGAVITEQTQNLLSSFSTELANVLLPTVSTKLSSISIFTTTTKAHQSKTLDQIHISSSMTNTNFHSNSPEIQQTQIDISIPALVTIGIMLLLVGSISVIALLISRIRCLKVKKNVVNESLFIEKQYQPDNYSLYSLNYLSGSVVTVFQPLEPIVEPPPSNESMASLVVKRIRVFDEFNELGDHDDSVSIHTIEVDSHACTSDNNRSTHSSLLMDNDIDSSKINSCEFHPSNIPDDMINNTWNEVSLNNQSIKMHFQASDGYIENDEPCLDAQKLTFNKLYIGTHTTPETIIRTECNLDGYIRSNELRVLDKNAKEVEKLILNEYISKSKAREHSLDDYIEESRSNWCDSSDTVKSTLTSWSEEFQSTIRTNADTLSASCDSGYIQSNITLSTLDSSGYLSYDLVAKEEHQYDSEICDIDSLQ